MPQYLYPICSNSKKNNNKNANAIADKITIAFANANDYYINIYVEYDNKY